MKLLLLDLDGTIREPKSGAKFINRPDDQQLIEGIENTFRHYQDWLAIGITNQGGVAAGHKSLEDAINEQRITIDLTGGIISQIYFCPDFEGKRCIQCGYRGDSGSWGWLEMNSIDESLGGFRKPDPGMLNLAIADCVRQPSEVLYVGDRLEDMQAAEAANIPFLWASDWRIKS